MRIDSRAFWGICLAAACCAAAAGPARGQDIAARTSPVFAVPTADRFGQETPVSFTDTEQPANAETSPPAANSVFSQRRTILSRLLTWPEKDSDAGKEDNGEGTAGDEEKEPPLESDRPDFTETSTTVGYKRLQIESGYTFVHGTSGDPTGNAHNLPELLVRYGVAERLELRVDWEGVVFEQHREGESGRLVNDAGSSDIELGFKYALTKQDKCRPQSAMIVALTAPAGSPAQSSDQVDAKVNYLYSWEFTEKLSLACSTGCLWTAESGDHFSQFFQSASVEYELTDKLHVYNEWFALLRHDSDDNRPEHYYDGGFTYLVTPNFQLDWRTGVGLSSPADRFFTGCGLVVRR